MTEESQVVTPREDLTAMSREELEAYLLDVREALGPWAVDQTVIRAVEEMVAVAQEKLADAGGNLW